MIHQRNRKTLPEIQAVLLWLFEQPAQPEVAADAVEVEEAGGDGDLVFEDELGTGLDGGETGEGVD